MICLSAYILSLVTTEPDLINESFFNTIDWIIDDPHPIKEFLPTFMSPQSVLPGAI